MSRIGIRDLSMSGKGHSHANLGNTPRRPTIALAPTRTFLIRKIIGAVTLKSMALLSDASHSLGRGEPSSPKVGGTRRRR